MDDRAKQALARKIVGLAQVAQREKPEQLAAPAIALGATGFIFYLVGDAAIAYRELGKHVLKNDRWATKLSEKYMDQQMHSILANAVEGASLQDTTMAIDKLVEALNGYSEEQTVYVPIDGILLDFADSRSVTFGQIVLKQMTPEACDQLLVDVRQIFEASGRSDEAKARSTEAFTERALTPLRNRVCAVYRVCAEPTRARERAEEECYRVFDILRYTIPFLYTHDVARAMAIGLDGEVKRAHRHMTTLPSQGSGFTANSSLAGAWYPYVINDDNLNKMSKVGIFKVAQILEKPGDQVTEYEDVLLRAIHWLADAQVQSERENKLLSLITCIETVFSTMPGDRIANSIAEGTAILLTSGLDSRKRMKKRMLDIYSSRSRVSHGGKKAVADDVLIELTRIASLVTTIMIDKLDEFRHGGAKALAQWIDDRRLGCE